LASDTTVTLAELSSALKLSKPKCATKTRAEIQKAYRQRQKKYVETLEKHFAESIRDYQRLKSEKYQLREYIIKLQERLMKRQGLRRKEDLEDQGNEDDSLSSTSSDWCK